MRLRKIRWQNICSTGNQFTEVDLEKHKTTLVVGKNGAGKSTMLDALSYALYKKPFRKVSLERMVNKTTGKNALAEVEFANKGHEWKVRRGMKPAVFEIIRDGKLVDPMDSSEYQKYLEEQVLGMNHKAFCQVNILGSANYVPFMQLPASARREVIEDLLDIQVFSTMNTLLKERVQRCKAEVVEADHAVKLAESRVEQNRRHLDELRKDNRERVEAIHARVAEHATEAADAIERVSAVDAELRELRGQLNDEAAAERRGLERDLGAINSRLAAVKREVEFLQKHDHCPTCKQGITPDVVEHRVRNHASEVGKDLFEKQRIEAMFAELNDRLAAQQNLRRREETLEREKASLGAKIASAKRFVENLQREAEALEIKRESVDADETATLEAALEDARNTRAEVAERQRILSAAGTLLKDGGIKARVIRQYVPVINKLTNKYLASMDFMCDFELNEEFEERIRARRFHDFSYEMFSEGEKLRIDLALLFAWRAIAKQRASVNTNLLVLDEVLDSSLDAAGADDFLRIITELTDDTNCFVISHKGDQLVDKFANVIRFTKTKNFSHVEH